MTGVARPDEGGRGAVLGQAGARRRRSCRPSSATGAPRPPTCSSASSATTRRRNARSAANIGYYADDPRRLAWPFFAIAQGGYLKSGGVFIKGGSRVLSMKLAKVVTKAGGSVLLGREASRRRLRRFGPSGLRPPRRPEDQGRRAAHRREAGLRQLRAARARAHAAGRASGRRSSAPISARRSRSRCSRRISASASRRRNSASTATASACCPTG